MKALFTKTLAVLLSAMLLFTAVPFAASAATTAEQSVGASSGKTGSCTWTLDNNGTLTISGNGATGNYGYNYNITTAPWGANIKSVVIENGVTSIGISSFYGCAGLTTITIPDSVTSIESRSFQNCTGLTSVTIGNSVTSIGSFAFQDCTGLTSVTIPDSVTSIGSSAFYNTAWYNSQPDGLVYAGKVAYKYKGAMPANTSIALKDGTKGIADYAFSGCTGLTSVTIPDSVTSIGGSAFSGCTGLKGVYISDLAAWCSIIFGNYSSNPLVYAHKLYLNNQHVTYLNIPEGVINISSFAYSGCTRLTSVTIPDSVTSIGEDAFYGCTGLTSLTIPDSVTSIGYAAFSSCTGLTGITIPDSVTSIGGSAFQDCTGLTSATIPDSVTSIGSKAFSGTAWYNNQPDGVVYAGKFAYEYKGTMPNNTSIVLKDGTKGIANSAFSGCTGLKSVTIPDSVTSIGYMAFYNCTGLTSITIPDSVTSIGGFAFHNCTGLTSVTIGNGVTSIENCAFGACTRLTGITIGNSVTSIGGSAFSGCTGLTSVTIPDSVTSIGSSAFSGCTGLTSVTIPDSVTSIGEKAFGYYYNNGYKKISGFTIYGIKGSKAENYANTNNISFVSLDVQPTEPTTAEPTTSEQQVGASSGTTGSCTWTLDNNGTLTISGNDAMGNYEYDSTLPWGKNITNVVIENGVTTIGKFAFYGCTGLTSVTIPDSVTIIGDYAFCECTGLKSVTIPDSVKSIGYESFSGCTGFTSVTIPDSVTSIGMEAFYNCTGLEGVYITDLAAWCNIKFGYSPSSNPLYYAHNLYLNNQLVTDLEIPDSVTSIRNYAFRGCKGLTSITIPDSVTIIGDYAFCECIGLKSVTIPDSVTSIGGKAFGYYYNNGYKKISGFTIYGIKGSKAEKYANTNNISFVSLDVEQTEPTTEEPMTEEPTTVEPTTEEPTTEEPTTAEPTTEQPDDPQGTDVTIKLAAPVSTFASRYTWNDAVFYYGNTSNFDDLTKVSMTDTGEKFYTTGTFNSTIITPGAWKIYSVTLTAEQIQAVDASKFAGFATSDNVNRTKLAKNANVFSAATGEYANYSSAASGAGGFDGKTFVFANASYGSTSPISYMGYWINSYVTVKAAAPMANTSYSRWDSMQLYYGNKAALADMETVDLFNTKETTKVTNSGDMTIKNGRWYIYVITLTDTQANAVDSAAYVGFKKAGAENRTSIMMNVLKAKTNSFDGTYGAKRTLNDLEGQVFVISGQTKTGISVATYVGQWKTRDVYTAGDNEEITIYFAVPKAVKAVDSWDTGVEFYYSNENSYKDAARMQMTPEPDYDIYSDFSGETFEQGSCSVYSLTIPAVKVREIDECKKVGFVKKGSYNRTYYAQGYAVTRASSVSDNQSYGLPQSIEAFDGNIFVITGCTDPNNERVTYTGWWN